MNMSKDSANVPARLTGLEVLFRAVIPDKNADVIVLVIHWSLVTNGILCVGKDDALSNAKSDESVQESELPPVGWNASTNPSVYALKYISSKKETVNLKAVQTQNILFVSLQDNKNEAIYSSTFVIDNYVEKEFTDYHKAFQNLPLLHHQIMKDLVQPLNPDLKKDSKEKTKPVDQYADNSYFEPSHGSNMMDPDFDAALPRFDMFHPLRQPVVRQLHPDIEPMPDFDPPMF